MRTFLIVVLFLVVSAVFAVDAAAQTPVRSVVGTWKLVSYEDRPVKKGPAVYPWGEHPSGLLIYDDTGHMAVQIQRTPVALASHRAESALTNAEKRELLESYTAYFGRYTVDWDKMTIVHHVEGNLFSFYNGTDQEKHFELTADKLILKAAWVDNGVAWTGTRVFERLRPGNVR